MDWTNSELFQLGNCRGAICYQGGELEIEFCVDVSEAPKIVIQPKPIAFTEESWNFVKIINSAANNQRYLPHFEIRGVSETGWRVTAEYATVEQTFSPQSDQEHGTYLAGSAEVGILRIELLEAPETGSSYSLEYLSRGQLGFMPSTADHALGTVSINGVHNLKANLEEYTGILKIQSAHIDASLSSWHLECDNLASRVLQVLSLAHGRLFAWEIRKFFCGDELVDVVVRTQRTPVNMRVAVVSHIHLEPILIAAVDNYTEELRKRTGLDVALAWFLQPTHSKESQFLHLMVALEHLVYLNEQSSDTSALMSKSKYKKFLRPALFEVIDSCVGDILSPDTAEALKDGVRAINRRSFYDNLLRMLDRYEVNYEDLASELRNAVNLRNDVVHRGLFIAGGSDISMDQRRHIDYLANIVEELLIRVFLTLLAYQGRYISALNNLEHRPFPGTSE